MKRIRNPKLEPETLEEQSKAGRYNPATVLRYKGWRIPLKGGTRDSSVFWVDGRHVFALTYNDGLTYAGLVHYELSEDYHYAGHDFITGKYRPAHTEKKVEECAECFINGDDLPTDFFDLSDLVKLKHLENYL
jgi:hypothetical protein